MVLSSSWAKKKKDYSIVLNWLSEPAEGKPQICQNMSFIISVFPHLQFILVAVSGWTSSAELLQQLHTKYQKVTQMWKYSQQWTMVFSFMFSVRTFQNRTFAVRNGISSVCSLPCLLSYTCCLMKFVVPLIDKPWYVFWCLKMHF